MSRPACLLLLIMLTATAVAEPPAASLSVNQLDRMLAGMRDMSDRKVASQLAGIKLIERSSSAQLERWEQQFPGARTREALIALVDASKFLRPPPEEISDMSAPDEQTLKQMHACMVDYVKNTLPRLPNFVAQRTTTAFEIATEERLLAQQLNPNILEFGKEKQADKRGYHALGPAKSSGLPNGQLYSMGSFSQTVTYRDGVETSDLSADSIIRANHLAIGLISNGEFGSVLGFLLIDTEPEKIVWDHWERSATVPLAVFHYSVPRDRSHFAVTFNADSRPDFPAYHGEIAIDPSTGVVFRITSVANTYDPEGAAASSLLVEFGPAQIGEVTYICPSRGVAMTKFYSAFADLNAEPPPVASQTFINDTSFTNYHVFRSNSRVLSGPAVP